MARQPSLELPRRLLAAEIGRLARDQRLRGRKPDELFVLWFLLAYASNDEIERAIPALTGHRGDRDVDAVLVDERLHVVHVVQGKYRDSMMDRAEDRKTVNSLAGFARALWGRSRDLKTYCDAEGMDKHAAERLEQARSVLTGRRNYWLSLDYVTLGYFPRPIKSGAHIRVTDAGTRTELNLIDGAEVARLLENYRDGVVRVPSLDLAVRPGARGSAGTLTRSESGLQAWVLTMAAEDIARIFERVGPGVFARNIRGGLGASQINKDVKASARDNPELFWFLNNGVTILSSRVEKRATAANEHLRVDDPQIINGQQTTRALHELLADKRHGSSLRRASLLVRVIEVPPSGASDQSFDGFVSSVVQATNWQNKIEASDLRSNDVRQVRLQRELRVLGYEYLRKRERKSDVRRDIRGVRARYITKFDLAQAVAGCEMEYVPLREGREPLFSATYYSRIFRSDDPYFYLVRYLVADAARQQLRGRGERKSMRWPIVYYLWQEMGALLERHADRVEVRLSDKDSLESRLLARAVATIYRATSAFYVRNRRLDGELLAVDDFFKRDRIKIHGRMTSPHRAFVEYWRSSANRKQRVLFEEIFNRLRDELLERAA